MKLTVNPELLKKQGKKLLIKPGLEFKEINIFGIVGDEVPSIPIFSSPSFDDHYFSSEWCGHKPGSTLETADDISKMFTGLCMALRSYAMNVQKVELATHKKQATDDVSILIYEKIKPTTAVNVMTGGYFDVSFLARAVFLRTIGDDTCWALWKRFCDKLGIVSIGYNGKQIKKDEELVTEDEKKKFCQMMEGASDEIFESTQSNPDNFVVAQDQKTDDAVEKVVFKKHLPSLKKTYLEGVWKHHNPTKPLVTVTDYNHMFTALTHATLNYVENYQCVNIKDFMHSTAKELTFTIDEVVAKNVDLSCCGTFNRGLLAAAVMCRATDSPNWMEEWRNFLQTLGLKGHEQTLKETKESLDTQEPMQKYQLLTVIGDSKMEDVIVTVERIYNILLPTISGNAFTFMVRQYRVTADVPSTVGLNDVGHAVEDRFAELLTRDGRVVHHHIVFDLSHKPVEIKKDANQQYVKSVDGSLYSKGAVGKVGTNQPVPCSPPHYAKMEQTHPKTQEKTEVTIDQDNPELMKAVEKNFGKKLMAFVGLRNTPATQHEIEQTLAACSEADAKATTDLNDEFASLKSSISPEAEKDIVEKMTEVIAKELEAKAEAGMLGTFATKPQVYGSEMHKFHAEFLKAVKIPPKMLGYPPTKVD